jgi:hypothetical protein
LGMTTFVGKVLLDVGDEDEWGAFVVIVDE